MKLTLSRKSNSAKSHAYYVKNPGVWIRYYKTHRGGKGFKSGGALSKRLKTKASKSRSIKTTKAVTSKISKVAVEKRSIYSYGPKKNVKSTANLKTKKFKGDIKSFDKAAETKAKASIAKDRAKASKTANEYINRMKDSGKLTADMRKKRSIKTTKASKSRSIKTTKSAASKISKVAVEKRSIYSYGPKKNVKSTANLKTKKFKGDIKAFDKVAETKAKASIAKEQAKASKTVNEYLNRMKDSGKRTAAMRKKRMSKLE